MRTIHEIVHDRGIQTRGYRVLPSTVDEKNRSVEAIIATESSVKVMDFASYEMVDEVLLMAGLEDVPEQVPLLDSHDRHSVTKVFGSTRDIRVMGDELRARNYFASDQASVDAFDKVKAGHIQDNSIGYGVEKFEMLRPGETRTIRDREFTAGEERPLKVVTEWSLRENSLTPIGADPRAKTRSKEVEMADSKKTRDSAKTSAAEGARAELEIETRAREFEARARIIRSICPSGSEHSPEAQRMLVAGNSEIEIREMLMQRMADATRPAGTPEEPPAPGEEDAEKPPTREMDDATFMRAITG